MKYQMKVVVVYDTEEMVYDGRKDINYDNINISLESSSILSDVLPVYDFIDQRCEIYYESEPPDELYIEICTVTDNETYQTMIPIRVYTVKPDYNYGISRYKYTVDYDGNKLYKHRWKK